MAHFTGEMLSVSYWLTSKVPVGANTTVNLATGAARFGRFEQIWQRSFLDVILGWLIEGLEIADRPILTDADLID